MICTSHTSYHRKRWIVPRHDEELVARLCNELRVPPLIARLLLRRDITESAAAQAFLDPRFKEMHSPFLLANMHAAAERIAGAVRAGEKITIYGDYDVDGITGTAMLWHTLKAAGADVEYYIPHRVEEGYGVNAEAIQTLAAAGTKLLVTIDCGCSAVAPIKLARSLGVDVVVSDHHEFAATLPPANAIVHPRIEDRSQETKDRRAAYPNPDLCGAGVAFKLAWAVAQKLCNAERVNDVYRGLLLEFSALAALGTIADVVPLIGENRIIVKHGLAQLGRTQFPGLRALIHAAGYGGEGGKKVDCTAVGFTLAPRLNAAGRMGHAREAVELLTTATGQRAEEIAAWLEEQNRDRQSIERKMVETAKRQVIPPVPLTELVAGRPGVAEAADLPPVIVVADNSFHAGVVGIVASRLVDSYHRPTFVLSISGDEAHGSARSVPGFELHHAIDHVRDLLISGGGHAMAGGVRLAMSKLDEFRARLSAYADEMLTEEMLVPTTQLDGVLELSDCSPAVIGLIDQLEPFGRGNPRPRFVVENVRLSAPPRRVGATGAHLQLTVASGGSAGGRPMRVARCIAFKMGPLEPQLPVGTELNLVVEPKINSFNGRIGVDLVLVDLARCSDEPFALP